AGETLVTPFSRTFSLGSARLELFPSGRAPGAASLRVETDGRAVAYAGEFDPRPGLAEPLEVRGADALVACAPLAALGRPLPPRAEAAAALVEAVRRAQTSGLVAVVLAGPIGGAEEALAALGAAGIAVRAH